MGKTPGFFKRLGRMIKRLHAESKRGNISYYDKNLTRHQRDLLNTKNGFNTAENIVGGLQKVAKIASFIPGIGEIAAPIATGLNVAKYGLGALEKGFDFAYDISRGDDLKKMIKDDIKDHTGAIGDAFIDGGFKGAFNKISDTWNDTLYSDEELAERQKQEEQKKQQENNQFRRPYENQVDTNHELHPANKANLLRPHGAKYSGRPQRPHFKHSGW